MTVYDSKALVCAAGGWWMVDGTMESVMGNQEQTSASHLIHLQSLSNINSKCCMMMCDVASTCLTIKCTLDKAC